MRLQRLVIGSGAHTLALDLEPGLTVIGGLDPVVRDALVGELLDSLAGARPGVHLEVHVGGRDLAVFRPTTGRHRVVDTASVADVTDRHLGPDGRIDLFAALGVDRTVARRTMRFGAEDLVPRTEADAWIARLAGADQERLWDTAMRCRAAEQMLDQAAAGGLTVDDAPVVREVEARHAALVAATDAYERMRLIALTVGTVGALGAAGMANLGSRLGAMAFVLVAVAGAALGIRYRRAVDDAARAERGVLRRAGADDYTTFHYERVSTLLDTDRDRRRFMQAVGDHRRAMEAWSEVAGPVPLAFALAQEREVRRTAQLGQGAAHDAGSADTAAELARAVLSRLAAVRELTGGVDVLPLVVDDPFDGLDPQLKPALLQVLAAESATQQVIVVSADPDVAEWATGSDGEDVALAAPTITAGSVPV